ncbi:MAG: MCE family protein [Prevotella sp.]|nr:MCE family protein [Prevotella sp.]
MNKNKEIKIALMAVVGLFILYIGMNFLKGASLFSSDDLYFAKFSDVTGLSESSPIYADGFKVGTVKSIEYDYNNEGNIKVGFSLDDRLRLAKGSSADIVSDMLGNVRINLLLANNPRERVKPGEIIVGVVNNGAMAKAAEMIPEIEKMLPKLDSIMSTLNSLLADPALRNSLHNMESVTGNLATTTDQANKLLAELNNRMPGMMTKADNVLANAEEASGKLAKLDVAGTMAKVDATLANVEQLTRELNNPNGTVGKLLKDPALYDHITQTVKDADSLVIDLKQHPKRYVHFSLF